jgi:hypothetical protein
MPQDQVDRILLSGHDDDAQDGPQR